MSAGKHQSKEVEVDIDNDSEDILAASGIANGISYYVSDAMG